MVDPKSMTIDIRALLGAFNEDTNAIGVVKVEVRGATRHDTKVQGKKNCIYINDPVPLTHLD